MTTGNLNETLYRGRRIRPTPEKHFMGGWLHVGHVETDDGVLVIDTKIPLPGLSETYDEAAANVVAGLKRLIDYQLARDSQHDSAHTNAA